jgi:protein-S-isoprenylcysteine O-methyltransferase Ste14
MNEIYDIDRDIKAIKHNTRVIGANVVVCIVNIGIVVLGLVLPSVNDSRHNSVNSVYALSFIAALDLVVWLIAWFCIGRKSRKASRIKNDPAAQKRWAAQAIRRRVAEANKQMYMP